MTAEALAVRVHRMVLRRGSESEVAPVQGRIAYVAGAPIYIPTKEVTIKTKRNTPKLTIKGVPVTQSQHAVYSVLSEMKNGLPDHALVPLAQHVSGLRLSSSGIRSRRAELTRRGLVKAAGAVRTASGRTATVWEVK